MKKGLIEIGGWIFVVVGSAGLFLPILPGILFILVGVTLLSVNHSWARRWLVRLGDRYPQARDKLQQIMGRYARHVPGLDRNTENLPS